MKRTPETCPYRDHLQDPEFCSVSSRGCLKGFDPGQLETGALVSDIRCWCDIEP